jgi:hypothetical protein
VQTPPKGRRRYRGKCFILFAGSGRLFWRKNCITMKLSEKLNSADEEFDMNPAAKPVKKSKKVEPRKKLERKSPIMSVRSLTVTWPRG